MKKIFSLIAALVCLLAGCGSAAAEPTPAAYDFIISTEYVAGLVEDYLQSDSYLRGVADYEVQMNSKNGGALLEKAVEYHHASLDGYPIDAVLLQLKTDVVIGDGGIGDRVQVYVDLRSGKMWDALTLNLAEITSTFTGSFQSEEEAYAILMNVLHSYDEQENAVFYHGSEAKKTLSAAEIAAVNQQLSLSYRGYENAEEANEGVDEETGAPVIHTDAQERMAKVTEMALALRDAVSYQQAALDPTVIQLSDAIEYKNDNFASGYAVHILMIHTDAVDMERFNRTSGTLLMDMNSGAMYTEADFDLNAMPDINAFTSVEDAYPWCILTYNNILEGQETQLWASSGETILHLTEAELETVNATLSDITASTAAERNARRQEAAASLTEAQRPYFEAALEFSRTPRYKEAALDPANIQLAAAAEYSLVHPENGFTLHVLLLQADGMDEDIYGFVPGIYLKDLNSGMGYTDTFMDLSNWSWNWEDWSDPNNVYAACILSWESCIQAGGTYLLMEAEGDRLLWLSETDLSAVNAALAQ